MFVNSLFYQEVEVVVPVKLEKLILIFSIDNQHSIKEVELGHGFYGTHG